MPVTRVFVVAEVRLYREGLAALLGREGFDVVGTGVDAESSLAALVAAQPELILLDVAHANGVDSIRRLAAARMQLARLSTARVITITGEGRAGYLYELRPHRTPLGELSAESLLGAIRTQAEESD